MIEVVGRIMRHPELLHDSARTDVGGNGEAYEFLQRQDVASILQDSQSSFGCQTLSPHVRRKAPADFYAGSEMSTEGWNVWSYESDESIVKPQLRRIGTKPMFAEVSFNLSYQCITLNTRETSREEYHHARIGVNSRKLLLIRLFPVTKDQARRLNHYCSVHAGLRNLARLTCVPQQNISWSAWFVN